jgi:hypothetical protein
MKISETSDNKIKLIIVHLKEDIKEEKEFKDIQELGDFLLNFTGNI